MKSQFQFVGFRVLCAFSFLHNVVEISAFSLFFFFGGGLSCFRVAQGGGGGAIPNGKKNVPFVKYLEL